MNVLQILPTLNQGGVETGTIDLARYLMTNGHKAVVISEGGRLVSKLDEIGARHYTLPVGKKNIINMFLMIPRIVDIIRKENIHIVHARSRVPAFSAYFAARKTRRKFITTAHGHYSKHFFSSTMGWGRFVIVASHAIAKHMIEAFGVPHEKIKLIPRGIHFKKFNCKENIENILKREAKDNFVITNIARITPLKGHDDFLKSVGQIFREIPNIQIRIVGDVEKGKEKYLDELKTLCRRLGISEYVTFSGFSDNIPEVLRNADLLVLSTKTPEAFGRTIVEAQASGVPVVATKVGGVVDIIEDGVNGLLCYPNDPKSMASAMFKVYQDKNLAYNMAKNAYAKVKKEYTIERMGEQTLACYQEAIDRKNILVIKLSALGDVILITPSLRAIRKKYPGAFIKILVGRESYHVVKKCPYVDDIMVFDNKKRSDMREVWKVASSLRKSHFDICFDFQNNRTSHLLAFLSFSHIRCGYDNRKLSFLLNKRVRDIGLPINPIEHQFKTLRVLGIDPKDQHLELWTTDEEKSWARQFLKENWIGENQSVICISPFASARWESKNWADEKYAKLTDEIAQRFNMRVVFLGTEEALPRIETIANHTKSKPVIAAGKTNIAQLIALIEKAKLLITTDSAPMHIASAMRVPFIAFFGPTDYKRHLFTDIAHQVLMGPKPCTPACYKPKCLRKRSCVPAISVDDVIESISRLGDQ